SHLRLLDPRGGGLLLDVLRDPTSAAGPQALPPEVAAVVEAEKHGLGLTPSQLHAYQRMCSRRVVAVWGPPGTGKTHFLAAAILGLARAHARVGSPFRALVTGFTHASIENVLRKIHELRATRSTTCRGLELAKVSGWRAGV